MFALVPLLYIAAVTPTLWTTDVAQHRLPNRLVLPGYPVAVASVAAQWILSGHPPTPALVSGLGYFAFMLTLSVAGGLGLGDVKLAGVLGIAAGLVGPTAAVASPLLAFFAGGVAAIAAIRRGPGTHIAFGPFMLAGFWAAVVLVVLLSPGGSST